MQINPQCSRKTFMAWYILFKFVISLVGHLGQAIGKVRHVRWFSWTLNPATQIEHFRRTRSRQIWMSTFWAYPHCPIFFFFFQIHELMTLKIWIKVESYTQHTFSWWYISVWIGSLQWIHCHTFWRSHVQMTLEMWIKVKIHTAHTLSLWCTSVPSMKRIPPVEGKLWSGHNFMYRRMDEQKYRRTKWNQYTPPSTPLAWGIIIHMAADALRIARTSTNRILTMQKKPIVFN